VSVNVDHQAAMHRHVIPAPRFAINILAAGQEAVSRRFAEEHPDRFDAVAYQSSPGGLPWLDGALATLECERHAAFEAGDHTIVVGRVTGGAVRPGRPLLYYRGGYFDLDS
jgi:flavin reductase (DIM6/NTAB) family NADH-FMN oxidoreductase RutF